MGNPLTDIAGEYSSLLSNESKKRATENNLFELERSARLEDANSVDSLSRGSFAAGIVRRKASQAIQEQRLAFAASGVDAGYGTPVDLSVSTDSNAEADVQQYLNNAMREAWGHTEVGRKYRRQKEYLAEQQANENTATAINVTAQGVGALFDFAMMGS